MSTNNNSILIIGPILPDWAEIKSFSKSLNFLSLRYKLNFVDPLSFLKKGRNKSSFYKEWYAFLSKAVNQNEAFIGFSFGGVMLQQCFDILSKAIKPVILCSTPSFVNDNLRISLNEVIQLSTKNKVREAIHLLNSQVILNQKEAVPPNNLLNLEEASFRLSQGLQVFLETDSRAVLSSVRLPYANLIGEKSKLVNQENVIEFNPGKVHVIARAGMRVLEDNLTDCKKIILESLHQ